MDTLPGLERLMKTCRQMNLSLKTCPPATHPPAAGTLIDGQPLDPMLAALYGRFGEAWLVHEEGGFITEQIGDEKNGLQEENQRWRTVFQGQLALPVIIFGIEPNLSYRYATVPELADENACQPVVWVDTYEDPYALPLASNVDRFFGLYSYYLEARATSPGNKGRATLSFPFEVPYLFARDRRLVELISSGRFDPLLSAAARADKSVQQWLRRILAAAREEQAKS